MRADTEGEVLKDDSEEYNDAFYIGKVWIMMKNALDGYLLAKKNDDVLLNRPEFVNDNSNDY